MTVSGKGEGSAHSNCNALGPPHNGNRMLAAASNYVFNLIITHFRQMHKTKFFSLVKPIIEISNAFGISFPFAETGMLSSKTLNLRQPHRTMCTGTCFRTKTQLTGMMLEILPFLLFGQIDRLAEAPDPCSSLRPELSWTLRCVRHFRPVRTTHCYVRRTLFSPSHFFRTFAKTHDKKKFNSICIKMWHWICSIGLRFD